MNLTSLQRRFNRLHCTQHRFFIGICILFVLESLWIAFTGRYPMAFDEDFHLGIIRIYASHISPFLAGQPAGADAFGAVARDPSYLYQYLMSFPYRLVTVFTNDQTIVVIWLRLINIALLGCALPLYRRLLLKTRASQAAVHGMLLGFILIPIVPLLAAQINYDNLLIPLVGLTMLLTIDINAKLKRYKLIDVRKLLILISLLLLSSIVQYSYLTILLAISLFLLFRAVQVCGWRKIPLTLGFGWTLVLKWQRRLLLLAVLISAVLFAQRYGINVIRYHTPVPDCGQVLTVKQCSQYGPWIRDYTLQQDTVNGPTSPLTFTSDWLYGMWLRTFFAVDGPHTQFQTRWPLLFPGLVGIVAPAAGLLVLVRYGRRVFTQKDAAILWLFTTVAVLYIAVLWLDEYKSFRQTGQAVAINGRYLLPIVLPVACIACLAFSELLRHKRIASISISAVLLLGLVWGGGALTYIIRSSDQWYWPNQTVLDANHTVQKVLTPVIPGTNNPSKFAL
jgi:hypothetical protein